MVQSRIVHKTALFLLLFVFPHQLVHGKISLKVISNDIYIYIYILWKNNTKTGITLIGMVKRLRKEEEEEERNVADKLKVEGLKD